MVVSEGAINNIMGGMENTAGVRLHSHRHKLKQRFDIVRKLGQGTYGKVQLAINKETGQEVAIKTIKKAKIETEQDLVRIRREIQIMSSVQHPQIIHIYEVFENREKMVLVMEYAAGGELYDYLSERKVLPEQEARRVFRQVSSAVYYCHKHKICHRDLKLENILLDLDGNAKIADFGLSNVFEDKQRLDTFCGSPLYASPEIVKGVPYVGPEVDCWSLGVLLYTLVYGAMPFDGSNFRRLVKQITQGDFYEPATPATASELIRHMLTVQSTERANIEDICSHWWVNEGYSESCLTEAEALANQTPVRLDLLLSLAPKAISSEHMLIQPDDEDISQRSDSERLPPNLKIPPPPPPPDEETAESAPLRSRSLGAVPPPGGVNVDMLLDKKEKRKKESSSKKPPTSKPPNEEEKKKKKEEKGDDEKKRSVRKRDSSAERERDKVKKRDASTERERDRVKKRESSTERRKRESSSERRKRDSSAERKKRDSSAERKKRDSSAEKKKDSTSETIKKSDSERLKKNDSPAQSKEVVKKTTVKKKEPSVSRKSTKDKNEDVNATPSPTLSTDTLVGVPKSPSKTPVPESKPEPKVSTKSEPASKVESKAAGAKKTKAEVEEKDTETILKETAAKIEKAEELKEPVTTPVTSPSALSPVTSSQNSIPSSQATSPVRSRTGSESSSDQRQSRSESSSRRQSKIFSKAALFDPLLAGQATKASPGTSPVDKPKKVTRPGALNMSDLAKKFEEKPSADKKNKVVAPFKVSDARKAFESKSDKSVTESPRRKASVGSSDSGPTSPKDSLSASPRDSLPTSPTRADKISPSSSSTPKTPSSEKVARETSPTKKVSKSPSKESSVSTVAQRRPKSPKKEVSPPKQVSKISSSSKVREEAKGKPEERVPKTDSKSAITKKEPVSRPCSTSSAKPSPIARVDSSDSSDSESEAEKMLRELSVKREKLEMAKKEKMKKVSEGKEPQPTSPRDMPAIREESQTPRPSPAPSEAVSPQQEPKEQKFATLPRGFKSKVETPKTLKAKTSLDASEDDLSKASKTPNKTDVHEDKSSPSTPTKKPSARRIPVVKEVIPIPPEQVLAATPRTPESEKKDIGSALPRPRVNSLEESCSGDSLRKKSQVEIVLNHNQQPNSKQPVHTSKPYDQSSKRSSFAEIQMNSPSAKETPRPEFRTEVQHSVGTPERGAAPEPLLQRARRERIIPIMLEDDNSEIINEPKVVTTSSRSSILQPSSSTSSKTSSVSSVPRSVGGFDGHTPLTATVGSSAAAERKHGTANASPETIRKSRRERIIPIAVEGEGIMTPPIVENASTERIRPFQRQGSSQGSFSRGRGYNLDRTESFSSAGEDEDDEEDDGFQILTAESLFSTLLSRVRSLTRKMTNEEGGRPGPDRLRRTPQSGSGLSSDSPLSGGASGPSSGFWSSLYSPPRDIPGSRRVSETLSRGHSREEDTFGVFAPPLWARSPSRDASDAESAFSESSATFSTLPRGWRTRRSGREESVVEGDEGVVSFNPSRRQFYSRTLSRDLPVKSAGDEASKRSGSRSSWDASSSSGTLPRSSASFGATIQPRFNQEPYDRVTSLFNNSNQSNLRPDANQSEKADPRERPFSTAGSSLSSSGEATGRVGGHFEQRDSNFTAPSASSQQPNIIQDSKTGKQPVQQLKDLVCELETTPDEKSKHLEISKGKPCLQMPIGPKSHLSPPKPSKSLSSFQKQHPLSNQCGSNPNLVFSVTMSPVNLQQTSATRKISGSQSELRTQPVNESGKSPAPLNSSSSMKGSQSNIQPKISDKPRTESDVPIKSLNTPEGITHKEKLTKNTFIPYNPNINPNSGSHKNLYVDKNIHVSEKNKQESAQNQNSSKLDKPNSNSEKRNGYLVGGEISNETAGLKTTWSGSSALSKLMDQSKKIPTTEKHFLSVEPYRKGRSEDLKAVIDMANASDNKEKVSSKLYKRSKSRDITPAIEAASEKFTQLNSSTLRRISPFEAYRRSKSRELGSAIDLTNNTSNERMKSPPPSNSFNKSDSSRSQFEKAKTSIEKKFEKAMSPPPESEILQENLKPSPDPLKSLSNVSSTVDDGSKEKETDKSKDKALKDSEKPKSVYRMITSKISRSLSNVGEERHESKQAPKDAEDESEKEDKFKLKRPSIFLKSKMEKSSSRTSFSEIESKDDDEEKSEKKTSKKLTNALNKFLGRKSEEKSSSPLLPKKSTSAAIITEKPKKTLRFRTKKFSKSQEYINQNTDDEADDKELMSLTNEENENQVNLESVTKDICNHLSQIEINLTSRIGTMSPSPATHTKPTNPLVTTTVPSITSYGLSPALASKRGTTTRPPHQNVSPVSHLEVEQVNRTKSSAEPSEDGSITPTDSVNESISSALEEIKETEDESVMDRITRKSYYSRFNDMKFKPKPKRIDSRDTMDQQLAAAKARLMQEEQNNINNGLEPFGTGKMVAQRSSMAASPPPAWDGVTRRNTKTNSIPRTTSLPPEDGANFYAGGIVTSPVHSPIPEDSLRPRRHQSVEREQPALFYRSNSVSRDNPLSYMRQPSINLEDTSQNRRLSTSKDDPSFYLRQPSVTRDEHPSYKLPSTVRDETPSYRRLSSSIRDDSQPSRRSSIVRDDSQSYIRSSLQKNDITKDRSLSSIPREDLGHRRSSSIRDENVGYHTLQYRKSSSLNDQSNTSRYALPHGRDSLHWQSARNETKSPSVSPSITLNSRAYGNADDTKTEGQGRTDVLAAMTAAGKAAGEAAAAAISSEDSGQRNKSPMSVKSPTEAAAVISAREELTRRLTPLTRLSNMGRSDDTSYSRPYRRTVTSGSLPLGQSEISSKTPSVERPSYRRTTTMDLPPTDSRIRTTDYRRVLQDPSRRFTGLRSANDGSGPSMNPSMSSARSSLASYLPNSSLPSSYAPPSMNTILRRTSLYKYQP